MKPRLVLLGPPASGKGTLAALISAQYGIPSASTGAMLREEKRLDTELGRAAHAFTKEGKYFPDEIALAVVEKWLDAHSESGGFLLDGFPRTLAQAEKFDELLRGRGGKLDWAINLELGEAEIRDRIEGRLTCAHCGKPFGERIHGLKEGDACPNCGNALQRRRDDTLATLAERLRQHDLLTAPVIEYYARSGRLRSVDAAPGSDVIFGEIRRGLEEVPA